MTHAEVFDPAVHLTPAGDVVPLVDEAGNVEDRGPMVYVETYCLCGGVHRQRDPVAYVMRLLTDWFARHDGPSHGEATKQQMVDGREEVRKAALLIAGRKHEYEPRAYARLHVDDTPRPWPVLPAKPSDLPTARPQEATEA
jgi:hypothetical protein